MQCLWPRIITKRSDFFVELISQFLLFSKYLRAANFHMLNFKISGQGCHYKNRQNS